MMVTRARDCVHQSGTSLALINVDHGQEMELVPNRRYWAGVTQPRSRGLYPYKALSYLDL